MDNNIEEEGLGIYFSNNYSDSEEMDSFDFEKVFEAIPSSYLILRPDFTIVSVTDAYLLTSQKTRNQLIHKNLFDIFPNDVETSTIRNLKKSLDFVLKEKVPNRMSITQYSIPDSRSHDGEMQERYWQPINYPVLNNSGVLIYIIHAVEDVTNFIKVQNKASTTELINLQLNDTRIFLESVLDNIPNIVFVKDASTLQYIKVNKAFEEMIGLSQNDIAGKTDFDMFPKSEAESFTKQDRDVLLTGKILDVPEEEVMTLLNGLKKFHTRKVPLCDQNRKSIYLIGISEDITEKIEFQKTQLAQKASEEVLKRKVKFLDIAAHELRTPITSLSLLIQMTQKKIARGIPLTIDVVARLKEPADRLTRLVIDLLEMSRLERGLLTLIPEKKDIVELISKCVEDFRIQAPTRSLVFHNPGHAIEVVLDPVRINQVLSNLIDNAIKYTNGSEIEVLLQDKNETVRVSICDHGPGIPKEQQKVLFTAFSRGSSDSTIKTSGLGLGLSVSHGIIELHKGCIGVNSDEGKGCEFYFEIPKQMTNTENN